MLPETSNVRMIVPSTRGRAIGRLRPGHRDREEHEGGDDQDRGRRESAAVPPAKSVRRSRRLARATEPLAARRPRAQPASTPPSAASFRRRPASIRRAASTNERDEPDREQHEGPEEGHARFRFRSRRSIAIRTIARTRSSSVDRVTASTPARRNDAAIRASRSSAAARNRRRNPASLGVDVELLAGLRVVHHDRPDVRQVDLAGVDEPDREKLVAALEELERALPARHADEVGDEDDERATLDPPMGGFEERREVGERRVRSSRGWRSRSSIRRRTWTRHRSRRGSSASRRRRGSSRRPGCRAGSAAGPAS